MPIQPKLPTWDARQVIDHDDLNTISRALGDIQQRFADNCPENAGQDFNPVLLDYFPAIVQADGGESSLTNPTDGKRVYLAAARPKESLNYGDAFDVEEESYPGIRPTDPFLATNMANLPDGGSMPPTNTPVICFHFWTRGVDGANSTDFYVFWWGGPPGLIPVSVSQSGGSAGDQTHPCSYTYNCSDLIKGTSIPDGPYSVAFARPNGVMDAGTSGTGWYDSTGTFRLWQVDEVPQTFSCTS